MGPTPAPCKPALNQLDKLGEGWLRHYHEIWAGGEEPMRDNLATLTTGDRRAVRQLLPGVRDTIGAMKKALTGLERSLEELDRKPKG
ncbi:hypothetical protein AYO44_06650 [Planctomycetaceae bacterium SCGC AG-212-F19]|nr:hypothetical protein AYO44_06650 [Planctomycetaceae bacterium SCGC AG-212-F19]